MRTRVRRCAIDFDNLVKMQKRIWEKEARDLGLNVRITETKVTSILASKLKKKRLLIKDVRELL